jgi:hypothetical protein
MISASRLEDAEWSHPPRRSRLARLRRAATYPLSRVDRAPSPTVPRAPDSGHPAPDLADSLELLFDVCQDCPVAVSLQSLVNESAQHHLEAHGPLELGGGRSRENPSPVHNLLGNGKQNAGLVLEHRYFPVLPA